MPHLEILDECFVTYLRFYVFLPEYLFIRLDASVIYDYVYSVFMCSIVSFLFFVDFFWRLCFAMYIFVRHSTREMHIVTDGSCGFDN